MMRTSAGAGLGGIMPAAIVATTAQDVGPVVGDSVFPDPVTDQPPQSGWDNFRFEDVKPFGRKIADAGNEAVTQKGSCSEDEIGETTRVRILFPYPAAGLIHEQAHPEYTGPRSRWPG